MTSFYEHGYEQTNLPKMVNIFFHLVIKKFFKKAQIVTEVV